jgi:hypothetical protein
MTPMLLFAAFTLTAAPTPPCACDAMGIEGRGRDAGALVLAAGIATGVTSVVAFSAGLEVERQLRAREVQGTAAKDALTARTVAAFVAWPAAVVSLLGVAGGAYLIAGAE